MTFYELQATVITRKHLNNQLNMKVRIHSRHFSFWQKRFFKIDSRTQV